MKTLIRTFLVAVALLGFAAQTGAQSGLSASLVFSGVTAISGPDTYAWLTWQPTDPSLLEGRVLALYRKSGNANSTSPFQRISVIKSVNDTRLFESLIPLAQKVGEDPIALNELLDNLLGGATPAVSVTPGVKITALLSTAQGNAERTRRIYVLALQHPAIALCAGLAMADKISGAVTYELRDFDTATNLDNGVLGRVTVDPASPLILPAPGAPFEVVDTSTKGNLNVSLRWSTPDALRDLAPLHRGFNLYRVPQSVAEAHGWNVSGSQPSSSALTAESQTVLVNTFPILPSKMLNVAEAAAPGDLTTVFATDDNNRFQPNGAPFLDNAGFYYFVTARDTLGRPGLVSPGKLVRILDRFPPNAPRNLRVRSVSTYSGTVRDQRFFVEWDAPTGGEPISAWYVYRWRSPHEIPVKSRQLDPITLKPERNLVAILPFATRTFTDDGSVAVPSWAIVDEPAPDGGDLGKTYFYTVRAADASVLANVSGNSAPAWGVLRDQLGPVATGGSVNVACFDPLLTFNGYTSPSLSGLPPDQGHLLLTCESTLLRGVEWAEFRWISLLNAQPLVLGRAHFSKNSAGQLVALLRKTLPNYIGDTTFQCRVGTSSGHTSGWVGLSGSPGAQSGKYILAKWNVALTSTTAEGSLCDWKHEAANPLTGASTNVTGTFTAPTDVKEFRIYRRVDDSPQTLISQGQITTSPVTWIDDHQLGSSATVEYFLQTLDVNSNPSPLKTQGAPLTVIAAMPTPMLEPISSVMPLTNARMRVKWLCSTAGVERFEIWVAKKSGGLPTSVGSGLSADLATHPNLTSSLDETAGLDYAVFQTGLARNLNSTGTPEFESILPVAVGETYSVMIRAVGFGEYDARAVGAFSNVEEFTYSLRAVGINSPLPWPDRSLAPQADFHSGVSATYLDTNDLAPWKGNAVRIGEYADTAHNGNTTVSFIDNAPDQLFYLITGSRPADNYLYINDALALAEPLETIPGLILPAVLYRVQISNTNFPTVPGDIVQVSPMMEQIAYIPDGPNGIAVTDPFVAILHESDTNLPRTATNFDHDVLLLDRQPVIKGARYKYFLVRFNPAKEIERVIVTNTVDVPL